MAFRHDARHQAAAVRLWRVCHRTHPSDWAPRRGMGLAGAARRRAAAFTFGAPQGWQRFALFVLASDGALFALCPVAPFGMALPRGAAAALLAEARGAGSCATTEAWLQQARSPAPPCRLLLPSAHAGPPCQRVPSCSPCRDSLTLDRRAALRARPSHAHRARFWALTPSSRRACRRCRRCRRRPRARATRARRAPRPPCSPTRWRSTRRRWRGRRPSARRAARQQTARATTRG